MATETEIEAMARALSHQAQEEPNVMWRNWTSQAAVAAEALDRVRADDAQDTEPDSDTQDEDHEDWRCVKCGAENTPNRSMCFGCGWGRPPQDEDCPICGKDFDHEGYCEVPSPVSGTEPDTAKDLRGVEHRYVERDDAVIISGAEYLRKSRLARQAEAGGTT